MLSSSISFSASKRILSLCSCSAEAASSVTCNTAVLGGCFHSGPLQPVTRPHWQLSLRG